MEKLFSKVKAFLENFSLDFDKLQNDLEEILQLNFLLHNCNEKMENSFDESKLFFKSGSVSSDTISFNKSRIQALVDLKIDDLDKDHVKNINKFYNEYDKSQVHTNSQEIVYDSMKKYKEAGAERYFSQMGSYKTIKYDLLDTIFHESEHVFQRKYLKYLENNDYPTDTKSKLLIFTMFFNYLYEILRKNKNIDLNYTRENYIFPIEFDARYESFKLLNEIKTLYFENDIIFNKYIILSNIIPENFDIEKTSQQIFKDYENVYKLYIKNYSQDYKALNEFLIKNKNEIINCFIERYNEFKNITLDCKNKIRK